MKQDPAPSSRRVVFVHHSVGRYMLAHGHVRGTLSAKGIGLWDTDYNKFGARDDGGNTIVAPPVPDDNTDPDGLLNIFARHSGADEQFIRWLAGFDLVALKSCYPASNIESDDELLARQKLYDQLVALAAGQLSKVVLLSPPPLAPLRTSHQNAARATRLAHWMATEMSLPGNITVFDLHSLLAYPGGQSGDGTLAGQYRRLVPFDSHPNTSGARAAGERLADHIHHVLSAEEGA
jgi:hypothetical protein